MISETFSNEGGTVKTFKTVNSKREGGTSLQGYFSTSYRQLVDLLGEPNADGDGYKVSTEWVLEDEDGNVATIYDWKETELYGDSSISVEQFREYSSYEWHIGANSQITANRAIQFLGANVGK